MEVVRLTVYLCQDPFLPVAEAFCPMPKSHDVNNLALSLLIISAHYPDLSVTGFVTLSSSITEAVLCFILINFLHFAPEKNGNGYYQLSVKTGL